MKSEILYPGAFPMARVQLAAGESLKAESGAMVSISPTIDVESKVDVGTVFTVRLPSECVVDRRRDIAAGKNR